MLMYSVISVLSCGFLVRSHCRLLIVHTFKGKSQLVSMALISTPFIRWVNHCECGKIILTGQALLWCAAEKVCYAYLSFKSVCNICAVMVSHSKVLDSIYFTHDKVIDFPISSHIIKIILISND